MDCAASKVGPRTSMDVWASTRVANIASHGHMYLATWYQKLALVATWRLLIYKVKNSAYGISGG